MTRLLLVSALITTSLLVGCSSTRYAQQTAAECSAGEPYSCAIAADLATSGGQGAGEACPLYARAFELATKRCTAVDAPISDCNIAENIFSQFESAKQYAGLTCDPATEALLQKVRGEVRAALDGRLSAACEAGESDGCVTFAARLLDRGDADAQRGFSLLGQQCANNDPSACAHLAIAHRVGLGTTKDEAVAAAISLAWCQERGTNNLVCNPHYLEGGALDTHLANLRNLATSVPPYGVDGKPRVVEVTAVPESQPTAVAGETVSAFVVDAPTPASRSLLVDEIRVLVDTIDVDDDRVVQRKELSLASGQSHNELDTNYNGRLENQEIEQGILGGRIAIAVSRPGALKVLLHIDRNRDGYLDAKELQLSESAFKLAEDYGKEKYAAANGLEVQDDENRTRATGDVAADGRLSISELANAMDDRRLAVGQSFAVIEGSQPTETPTQ